MGVIPVAKYRARGRDQIRRRTREGSTERGQVTAPFIVRAHAVSGGAARLTEGQGEPACRGITETWSVSHVALQVHVSTMSWLTLRRACLSYFGYTRV